MCSSDLHNRCHGNGRIPFFQALQRRQRNERALGQHLLREAPLSSRQRNMFAQFLREPLCRQKENPLLRFSEFFLRECLRSLFRHNALPMRFYQLKHILSDALFGNRSRHDNVVNKCKSLSNRLDISPRRPHNSSRLNHRKRVSAQTG